MVPAWLANLSLASLIIAVVFAFVVIVDLFRHPQKMKVMDVVWPITALYAGPLGLWAYYAIGRKSAKPASQTGRRSHDHGPDKPFWESTAVGSTHCGAGCAIGDGIGECIVAAAGWLIVGIPLWPRFIADFGFAYLFGIGFQYFSIVPMRHLKPLPGIAAAVKADTLSITAFELGMFGWMALTYFVLFDPPLTIGQPAFWFMMQVAMICGFLTTYPMNWWLLRRGIKEVM